MILPLLPSNSCASSSFSHPPFPSLYFLLIQSQNQPLIRFRTSCCREAVQPASHHFRPRKVAVEIPTKKKRKPRPSFIQEVQDKWSQKLHSPREKFPWQDEVTPVQNSQPSGLLESPPETSIKPTVSERDPLIFALPSCATSAPWTHGSNALKPQFNSQPQVSQNPEMCENFDRFQGISETNVLRGSAERKEEIVGFQKGEDEEDPAIDMSENLVGSDDKLLAMDGKSIEFKVLGENRRGSNNLPYGKDGALRTVEADGKKSRKKSNTPLAEKTIPGHDLRRLRNAALRMLERIKVGPAGVTQALVDTIHEKWKLDEVVKLKFEEPLSLNMKRAHEVLENKTGGLVIWRSGSSVVLYRGITYKFPCVQSFVKRGQAFIDKPEQATDALEGANHGTTVKGSVRAADLCMPVSSKYPKDLSKGELMKLNELNHLLDELGPRFRDWSGCEPLPVDADLLPSVVPEYKSPFRVLPYGLKPCLTNQQMTKFRRLARTMAPHFALGRNKDLQGLAKAMVKLWEKSAIAKIAIKRGVQNTCNERMAEEIKRLTGGTLLSRNKDFIVFYRGNDFLPPVVTDALKERCTSADLRQDEEEQARQTALAVIESNKEAPKATKIAGTLAETRAATSHWGREPSSKEIEDMMRDSAITKHTLLVRSLENKLALAKGKLKKAENALGRVQEYLQPAEIATDLETIADEERFLFRKIGLSMKPFLLLGRRGVYDGTIENMHLHWKHRELVKVIVRGKTFAQVKHIAISLEAESGGVLVSLDKTTKGHAVIVYRGKNYQRPTELRAKNLLSRRQALARSIELQRREALKHHIEKLQEKVEMLRSELEDMQNRRSFNNDKTYSNSNDPYCSDDGIVEDEGEEAYLKVYDSGSEGEHDQSE